MVQRVHGGVLDDQNLTGSLRFFKIAGADFSTSYSDGTFEVRNLSYGSIPGDLTGVISGITLNAAGTGYEVGDRLAIGAAQIDVKSVDDSGAITSFDLFYWGNGQSVGTGIAATGGTGSSATFDITSISNASPHIIELGNAIPNSSAEAVYNVIAEKATIVVFVITSDGEIHVGIENTGNAWDLDNLTVSLPVTATELETAIQAIGIAGEDDASGARSYSGVDVKSATVSEVVFTLV